MKLAVSFTNLGPYHRARLRGLAAALAGRDGTVLAIETAAAERKYAWEADRAAVPFETVTLFPDQALEDLPAGLCATRIAEVLDTHQPDAVAVSGYVRPECLAAAWWARRRGLPRVLMSESQAIDRPRVWWKEAVKRRRVAAFSSALVGGPSHRDYLVRLGMPADRIALGYNAVDHDAFARESDLARAEALAIHSAPPYFLTVCRFAPEKNLETLLRSYAAYVHATSQEPWRLVLAGSGELEPALRALAHDLGVTDLVEWPGFLQTTELMPWYAGAGAFVLASRSEPWGLVVNEAAASALPLLVSDRAGCAATLVPDPPGTTGQRFDPDDGGRLARLFDTLSALPHGELQAMGRRAREVAAAWGPARFGQGLLEALDLATTRPGSPTRTRSLLAWTAR